MYISYQNTVTCVFKWYLNDKFIKKLKIDSILSQKVTTAKIIKKKQVLFLYKKDWQIIVWAQKPKIFISIPVVRLKKLFVVEMWECW